MKVLLIALTALSSVASAAVVREEAIAAPTLSEWGLLGLGLILAVAAGAAIRRRK